MRRGFGHIQKLNDGLYRVYWYENNVKKSHRVHGSPKDAELYLAKIQLRGTSNGFADLTLSEYWRVGVAPTFGALAERTAYDYNRLWARELAPRFGDMKLTDVTWRNTEKLLAGISSPIVQRDSYKLLRKIMNMAVRDGFVLVNPIASGVKLKTYRKRDKMLYDRSEALDVLTQAVPFKHYPLLLLELGGGLRHEEACAVTQQDVTRLDCGGSVYAAVSVSKALTNVGTEKILKETKTDFSERLVIIGAPFALPMLGTKSRLPLEAAGQSSPMTITHNWKRYAVNNNLKHIPFANMRTNYSVLHAEAGTLDSLVSLAMGHSGGTTRSRNYLKQTQAGLIIAADSLAEYLLST